jgi:CBS domain-containing protein
MATEIDMLIKDVMSKPVVTCTPWDTAKAAATLMKTHSIGAIPVVSDISDPLLEGIITDRDLCIDVVTAARSSELVAVADVMSCIPVTCQPEDTLEGCMELMRNCQVRRVPVVDQRGRCVGIVSQADITRYAPAEDVAVTLREISDVPRSSGAPPLDENYFYCGRLHELDQIALLERRRQQAATEEVLT